jgi:hypothetical protein
MISSTPENIAARAHRFAAIINTRQPSRQGKGIFSI